MPDAFGKDRLLRIIDANANRAREAMRVLEDAARFALDDATLARRAKLLRHDLRQTMDRLPAHLHIERHRDTPGDVGTAISANAERQRADLPQVAIAAGKRLSESLRCLEEFGKTIDPMFAEQIEQLRYRGYDVESDLHKQLARRGGMKQWRLCVIITEALCTHHPWSDTARAALDGGADCLQLREKQLDDDARLARARKLVHLAGERADVIVNDRVDLALACGAAGVHLGEHDLPIDQARQIAGRALVIGASTHNLAEAKRAIAEGADYCGVGAMFATDTKQRRPSGVKYLRAFVKHFPGVAHLAIGGITPENLGELVDAGCGGVAVSRVVCSARRPATVVRKLKRALPK